MNIFCLIYKHKHMLTNGAPPDNLGVLYPVYKYDKWIGFFNSNAS